MTQFQLIQWFNHLGDGVCEIMCNTCEKLFYYNKNDKHHNGQVICQVCDKIDRWENVAGRFFTVKQYPGETGGRNWVCGKCGVEFPVKDGETENTIECPSCKYKREEA